MRMIQTFVTQAIREHPEAAAREVPEILGHYIADNTRLNHVYRIAKVVCFDPSPRNLKALGNAIREAEVPPPNPDCPWCAGPDPGPPVKSHKMCERHAREFMEEVP